MCGICGLLGYQGDEVGERLEVMTARLAHRGPDDQRQWREGPAALGHAHLKIMDAARSRQPQRSKDGRYVLVFNGELYNRGEIAAWTADQGEPETGCDTELALRLLAARGREALERMVGMFAFALWDRREKICLLARDRAGEKPLFFRVDGEGRLLFASEIRALIAALPANPPLDRAALERYLVLGYAPSPQTLHQGISQLPPGAWAEWRPGKWTGPTAYWDVFALAGREPGPPRQAEELLEVVRTSVTTRLVADTEPGILLSGGVDSSGVAALAREATGKKLSAFSLGFSAAGYDELDKAVQVARALELEHHQERIGEAEVPALAARAFAAMDGALGDPSWLPTFALSELARRRVKVVLGGDGADELFAGYQGFQAESLARTVKRWSWLPWRAIGLAVSRLSSGKGYRTPRYAVPQFLQGLHLPRAERHLVWLGAFAPGQLAELLPEAGDPAALWDFLPAAAREESNPNLLLALYFRYYLGDLLLVKSDRASMAHALELRSPFLDGRLIELAFSLPYEQKIRKRETKHLLRRAFQSLLPPAIAGQPKHGFAPPVSEWFRGPLREDLAAAVRRVTEAGLARPKPAARIQAEHLSGRRDHRRKLWMLYALGKWQEQLKALASSRPAGAGGWTP